MSSAKDEKILLNSIVHLLSSTLSAVGLELELSEKSMRTFSITHGIKEPLGRTDFQIHSFRK